jgi:hypothetical protein
MKMAVFCDITPCRLVEVYRRFRDACCFGIAPIMETASTSKTSVNFTDYMGQHPSRQRSCSVQQEMDKHFFLGPVYT